MAANNPYESGDGWFYNPPWEKFDPEDYPDPDFCFKTYYAKQKYNPYLSLTFIEEHHPHLFNFLSHLLSI